MSSRRILIVDDEVSFTWLMKLNLEDLGHFEVKVENRASRALSTAKRFRPDLVLLDMEMPDGSGDEVAARLESDADLSHVPVLFLTASESPSIEDRLKRFTAMGRVFRKPANVEEIVAAIEGACSRP